MKYIRRIFHYLYLVYAVILFVAILLLIFPVVLFSILLGQPKSGNLVVHLCRFWSDSWLFAVGIRSKILTDWPVDPKRHYVFVANHASYLDIPIIFQAVRNNAFRVLGKSEMAKIPVFGTLYKLAVVLVDRSSNAHRAKSIETLKKILNQNISIFIFPEGTFNETGQPLKHFYDGAFRIAIQTQTPVKPILFIDSVARMHFSSPLSLHPGVSRMVILPEIPVDGLTMTDLPRLKQQVFFAMEEELLKYRPQQNLTIPEKKAS